MEVRKHEEAISAAWSKFALIAGGVFVGVCSFITAIILSFMGRI